MPPARQPETTEREREVTQRVQSLIDYTRRRLNAMEQISLIIAEFPEIADELGVSGVEQIRRPNDGRRLSNFERIRLFFSNSGNEWAQASQIGEALNMSRGTVATVLWTSYRDRFEEEIAPGFVRRKRWRLVADVTTAQDCVAAPAAALAALDASPV